MSKIGKYNSPDLPSFEEIQAGSRTPEMDGDRQLIDRVGNDLQLYVHETVLREAGAAFAQGAINRTVFTRHDSDARARITARRNKLNLGDRP